MASSDSMQGDPILRDRMLVYPQNSMGWCYIVPKESRALKSLAHWLTPGKKNYFSTTGNTYCNFSFSKDN